MVMRVLLAGRAACVDGFPTGSVEPALSDSLGGEAAKSGEAHPSPGSRRQTAQL
jgi:hypothetical protein